ncbi:MAG: MBL fold metallo-hydrolase [Acidimicrobiia bacterium]|nr:MBL fold metallo-hydrolase [Acidimicrobiia bacterium]
MDVTILGCRGSTPATGAEFTRYGGDTSSVAVAQADESPTLILDAGTGLSRLSETLGERPFRGSILLTHLHWDHTHGLPFAPAVDRDDAVVDLYLPSQGVDPAELLSRAMGPPHFPIEPTRLRGIWRFHALEEGKHHIAGFDVVAGDVPHKGGRTFGYRIDDGDSSLAYIPDYWLEAASEEPTDLVTGVGLLLHDSQHTAAEMDEKSFLGHSSVEYAVELARRHGVGELALFHHDPKRTDDAIDQIIERVTTSGTASAAAAGRRYTV